MKKITLASVLIFSFTLAGAADAPFGITGVSKQLVQAAQPITAEEEISIGRDVAANVIAQFGLYNDEALTDYVNLVGLTVAQYSPKQDVPYRFAILDTDILNAFAAPGGYIFVTKGLLALLKDEAQLASVLGHEIGHVSQKHVIKSIQKARMADAAILGYAKASAEKAKWMKQVTDMAVQMLWKGLSREDELDSDRVGIDYASQAGYDAVSFKEVLELLKSRSASAQGPSADVKFLLSTHPKPEDRISAVEKKLALLSPGGARLQDRFAASAAR